MCFFKKKEIQVAQGEEAAPTRRAEPAGKCRLTLRGRSQRDLIWNSTVWEVFQPNIEAKARHAPDMHTHHLGVQESEVPNSSNTAQSWKISEAVLKEWSLCPRPRSSVQHFVYYLKCIFTYLVFNFIFLQLRHSCVYLQSVLRMTYF